MSPLRKFLKRIGIFCITSQVAFVGGFGVAVSKNLLNAGLTNISTDQLAAVLSGAVENWNQIGGPNLPVRVCRRSPGSGTQATFNQLVSRKACGANLTGADLSGADLSGANLTGTDLSYANLRHAKLDRVNLAETTLTGAIR